MSDFPYYPPWIWFSILDETTYYANKQFVIYKGNKPSIFLFSTVGAYTIIIVHEIFKICYMNGCDQMFAYLPNHILFFFLFPMFLWNNYELLLCYLLMLFRHCTNILNYTNTFLFILIFTYFIFRFLFYSWNWKIILYV